MTSAPGIDYTKKWYVLGTVGTGVILATIDGSIVNVALPTMRAAFGTSFAVIQWVVIGYLLTLAALTLGVGRVGDIVGKKRIYTVGFGAFTVASVACGLAPTVSLLIIFRILQAIGAAMVLSLGVGILTEAFPPQERGKAIGWIGTFVSVGVITGPAVGGVLIESFDWQSIFFVNIPVGIVGTALAIRYVPNTAPVGGQRFDFVGALLLSSGLVAVSLALTRGQELGFTSGQVLVGFVAFAVLVPAFVIQQRRSVNPMIDLALFRNPMLTVSVVSGWLVFVAVSSIFILLPFYLEDVLGYDTRATGLLMAVAPLLLGVVAPMAGSWSDRVGIRRISLTGLVLLLFGVAGFRLATTDLSLAVFIPIAVLIGLGMGIFQSPNNSAIMGSVPARSSGVAGGILTLTRLLGQISGAAILGSIWAARVLARAGEAAGGDATQATADAQAAGLRDVAWIMIALVGVAIVVGWAGLRRETEERRRIVAGGAPVAAE